MTELEEVFSTRAELGLGFEGHAVSGIRLSMGWDGRIGAILLTVGMEHSWLHQAELCHPPYWDMKSSPERGSCVGTSLSPRLLTPTWLSSPHPMLCRYLPVHQTPSLPSSHWSWEGDGDLNALIVQRRKPRSGKETLHASSHQWHTHMGTWLRALQSFSSPRCPL